MKRLQVRVEAHPLDPTQTAVRLADGQPSVLAGSAHAQTFGADIPTHSVDRGGRVHRVRVMVETVPWTRDALAQLLLQGAMQAADASGLELDMAEARKLTRRLAARRLSPWRRLLANLGG